MLHDIETTFCLPELTKMVPLEISWQTGDTLSSPSVLVPFKFQVVWLATHKPISSETLMDSWHQWSCLAGGHRHHHSTSQPQASSHQHTHLKSCGKLREDSGACLVDLHHGIHVLWFQSIGGWRSPENHCHDLRYELTVCRLRSLFCFFTCVDCENIWFYFKCLLRHVPLVWYWIIMLSPRTHRSYSQP
jgi:hypothetical protein